MIELKNQYGSFVRIGEKHWIDFSKVGAFHTDTCNNLEILVDGCKIIISADDREYFIEKLQEFISCK